MLFKKYRSVALICLTILTSSSSAHAQGTSYAQQYTPGHPSQSWQNFASHVNGHTPTSPAYASQQVPITDHVLPPGASQVLTGTPPLAVNLQHPRNQPAAYSPNSSMQITAPMEYVHQAADIQPTRPQQSPTPSTTRRTQSNAGNLVATRSSFTPTPNPDLEHPRDPILALESKVASLQHQLESMQVARDCVEGCACDICQTSSPGGLYFGAAAIFAKPHLKEAFQYSRIDLAAGNQALIPFEYDYEASIRAWLGFKTQAGFGFRTTYWNFDADGQTSSNVADGNFIYGAHAVSVIFPANIFAVAPGEQMVNSDSLKTQVLNFFGTYDTTVRRFDLGGGMGLRYARLEQTLDSNVFATSGGISRRLNWQREYSGLGPSATVDVKRRIGQSPFSVFGQGGGALLYGKKSIRRSVQGDQSPQPALRTLTLEDADEVVGIGEVGFGLEWSRQLRGGRYLSIRGLYEGQLWAEAGAPTLGFLGFESFGVKAELKR